MDLDEVWNISEDSQCALTKNSGKSPQGSTQGCQNVFCFFSVTNSEWTFGHLSCTDFDRFWNERCKSCTCINRWKISKLLHGGFTGTPKQLKWVLLRGVYDRGTAQTALFQAIGIILTSQGCAFCEWVLVGMCGLGAISPWKNQFRRSAHDVTSWFNVTCQGSSHLFEPILQCILSYTATHLVK